MRKSWPLLAVLEFCAIACNTAPTELAGVATPTRRANRDGAVATTDVVMSRLEKPLGLAFGPEGGLYVTEAGSAVANGPCAIVVRGRNCYSGTGAISRLWQGRQERVASGLPSVYNPDVPDILGPARIAFQGRGGMYVTIEWSGAPDARARLGAVGGQLGTLIRVLPNGAWDRVADVAAYEQAHDPDGSRIPDSNPFGLLAEPGRQFVTDAGGNDLLEVSAAGSVSLVATFAPVPIAAEPFKTIFGSSQAVPTQVRRGPDGALYVSELPGAPFLPGLAGIYRVRPGQAPQLVVGGLTQVTDFDWAPDGSLYVLQVGSAPFFGGTPSVLRVAPDGTRRTVTTALSDATALSVGPDGAIHVSQHAFHPGTGEVIRIVP